jgi:hypothetical protein
LLRAPARPLGSVATERRVRIPNPDKAHDKACRTPKPERRALPMNG